MFDIQHDRETYCWLKVQLQPRYTVVAEPQPGYFSEQLFYYRVFDGSTLLHELRGDYRDVESGSLVNQAKEIVRDLREKTTGAA